MSKNVYFSAFCGEWGWELASWIPSIRAISKGYNKTIIEVQPGMEYFYRDFSDELILNPRDSSDFDMYSGKPKNPPPSKLTDTDVIIPTQFWKQHARWEFRIIKTANRGQKLQPKEWRKYGTENPKYVADIMCAWRGPKHFRGRSFPEKVYPTDKCIALTRKLMDAGYSVACYGGEDNVYVEGSVDYRGVPVEELCGALSQAKLAIGPSSGTLHLASLCGTPHVTWYGRPVVSMDRYLTYWNPFETPVTFISGSGCPDVDIAFENAVKRMDSETKKLNWIK